MAAPTTRRLRVFVDANVFFAGAASPSAHSASLVVLQLAEITLMEALTSEQVITETERNLEAKLPQTLPTFRHLVSRCLRIVPDPQPADLHAHIGLAVAEDLPILVAALREGCPWLVTFNVRHFQPGDPQVSVVRPGELVARVRDNLSHLETR
jgi:predicted nucleic acid-binding protein